MTDYNQDGILESTYSILQNRATGLGTSRDKSLSSQIDPYVQVFSVIERNALFRKSKLLAKVVTHYPNDGSRSWVEWTSKNNSDIPQDLEEFFIGLKGKSIKTVFRECSIEARLHGDAYCLIGIDDGQDLDKPINERRIRSFDFLLPLTVNDISPNTFDLNYEPDTYYLNAAVKGTTEIASGIKIHSSRILHFTGTKLPQTARYDNAGRNDSVFTSLYAAFASYFQGLSASSAMLQDYSMFVYKLKGLAKLIKDGQQDVLLQRFLTLQMGMGVLKGLITDESEEVDFVERNFSGAKDILQELLDHMIANCDVPKFVLLGSTSSDGRGTRSKEEREEWASLVGIWQEDNWREPLERLKRLALIALYGKIPKGVSFNFKNSLKLTATEEAEIRLLKAQEHKLNIESGIYTAFEARMSTYGNQTFNTEITLNPDISQALEQQVLKSFQTSVASSLTTEESSLTSVAQNTDSVTRATTEELEDLTVFDPLDVLSGLLAP